MPNDMSNLPPSNGTTLYKLLTDPDGVSLENITMEAFIVRFKSTNHNTVYILRC
jgi:hypothetical protein